MSESTVDRAKEVLTILQSQRDIAEGKSFVQTGVYVLLYAEQVITELLNERTSEADSGPRPRSIPMTSLEMLEYLKKQAISYVVQGVTSVMRNRHMNEMNMMPPEVTYVAPEFVEAVVVDFINHVAMANGIDYGLYTIDINQLRRSAKSVEPEAEE